MKNLVLAATLICGATTFTSCSVNDDNSSKAGNENRKEFIRHTRENLKDIAQNLNFYSWAVANNVNQEFNTTVLNNPEFEKTIIPMFTQKVRETIQPVEEGSELAEMGYKQYATIDLTEFNYRFTMKEDGSSFDVEPAEDFEMIINGFNPTTQEVETGIRKLKLQASGDSYKQLAKRLGNEELAVVILIPEEFVFSIATKVSGAWEDIFTGQFLNIFEMSGESEFVNPKTDKIAFGGKLRSDLPNSFDGKRAADATELVFYVTNNPVDNENSMGFSFGQNGKSMIKLETSGKYTDKDFDLSQFSQFTTSGRILDVLVALASGSTLKGTISLNDDLNTDFSISDCGKAMQLQHEMAHARRNYADQATIEEYTKQLNELVSAKMTCKGVNQVIPMKLQTEKFGVDYWAMPAFNFADEKGYVPIIELLDKESVEYGINIIDHAAEPMAGSIITVRQLLQFVQNFIMQARVNQASK
jgi:hypothetical protein